jgi:hypothetical protein
VTLAQPVHADGARVALLTSPKLTAGAHAQSVAAHDPVAAHKLKANGSVEIATSTLDLNKLTPADFGDDINAEAR